MTQHIYSSCHSDSRVWSVRARQHPFLRGEGSVTQSMLSVFHCEPARDEIEINEIDRSIPCLFVNICRLRPAAALPATELFCGE